MSITAGIAAVKASLDVAKIVSDRLNVPDVDVADVRAKVHEMLIHMVNAQIALGEAHGNILELQRQLEDRKALELLKADMDFMSDGGFYVRRSEREKGAFNPCCPVCFGLNERAVSLVPLANGYYTCAVHKAAYKTTAYREEEKRREEKARADEDAVSVFRPGGPDAWMR